ncbi:MAG: hypothetical protein HY996_03750 [Micrococcales bacterium]|nr:hypothetical protein [Micrococcales bacterium]
MKHSVYLTGVDAGGSSTRAVVVDATGHCIGYARAGSGNPTSAGAALAAANVVDAVEAAVASAGSPRIERTAVAMAGASQEAPDWLDDAFGAAGLRGQVSVEADLAAVYLSGSRARLGYAAIAGTGTIAARLRDHAIEEVADGLGWLIGDDGSGFWIGHRVVRAVAAELDGRAEPTALTPAVLRGLGVERAAGPPDVHGRPSALAALVGAAYAERPVRLARFAPAAFAAAAAGDPAAERIVRAAAEHVAASLASVVGAQRDGPVVLGGSVLARQPAMRSAVRSALASAGVTGPVVAVPDGVVGSAVLALERHGIPVDERIAARITASLAGLRSEREP